MSIKINNKVFNVKFYNIELYNELNSLLSHPIKDETILININNIVGVCRPYEDTVDYIQESPMATLMYVFKTYYKDNYDLYLEVNEILKKYFKEGLISFYRKEEILNCFEQ